MDGILQDHSLKVTCVCGSVDCCAKPRGPFLFIGELAIVHIGSRGDEDVVLPQGEPKRSEVTNSTRTRKSELKRGGALRVRLFLGVDQPIKIPHLLLDLDAYN
jgi:hypothetical protein